MNNTATAAQKLKDINTMIDGLAEAVDTVKASAEFTAWLNTMSKFWKYSWNNGMLIAIQCKDATNVAGFHKWKNEFKRFVKKGEKAISILAPTFAWVDEKDKETKEKTGKRIQVITGFVTVPVFDVSQTDGTPLPECPHKDVAGNEFEEAYRKMWAVAEKMGIKVSEETLCNDVRGYSANGTIVIHSDMDYNSKAHVFSHELGHELIHHGDDRKTLSKNTKELEAEAIAYVVSTYLGMDVEMHSCTYLASYKGNSEGLKASMERIAKTAKVIISGIEDINIVKPLKMEREMVCV